MTIKSRKASKATENSIRAKYRNFAGSGKGTGEGLRTISCPGCWCGREPNHDWPGKAEGEPHPRDHAYTPDEDSPVWADGSKHCVVCGLGKTNEIHRR